MLAGGVAGGIAGVVTCDEASRVGLVGEGEGQRERKGEGCVCDGEGQGVGGWVTTKRRGWVWWVREQPGGRVGV